MHDSESRKQLKVFNKIRRSTRNVDGSQKFLEISLDVNEIDDFRSNHRFNLTTAIAFFRMYKFLNSSY